MWYGDRCGKRVQWMFYKTDAVLKQNYGKNRNVLTQEWETRTTFPRTGHWDGHLAICCHSWMSVMLRPSTGDLACFVSLPDHEGVHNFSWHYLNIIKLLLFIPFLVIEPSVHKRYSNIKLISVFSGQFWGAGKSLPWNDTIPEIWCKSRIAPLCLGL